MPTNLIVFQYNPDTMTRGFQQLGGSGGTVKELRQQGDNLDSVHG